MLLSAFVYHAGQVAKVSPSTWSFLLTSCSWYIRIRPQGFPRVIDSLARMIRLIWKYSVISPYSQRQPYDKMSS